MNFIFSIVLLLNCNSCQASETTENVPSKKNDEIEIILSSNAGDDIDISTDGLIFSSDYGGDKIRQISETGSIQIIKTGLVKVGAIALDKSNSIYATGYDSGVLLKINGDFVDTLLTGLNGPAGLIIDKANDLMYIATNASHQIYKYNLISETLTLYISGELLNWPTGLAVDTIGNIYVANMFHGEIIKVTTTGTMSKLATLPSIIDGRFNLAYLTYLDGFLYVNHFDTNKIYKINAVTGASTPFKNDLLLSVKLTKPTGIAVSKSQKHLLITDENNSNQRLIKLTVSNN